MGRSGTCTAQAALSLHSNPGREMRRLNKARCRSEDVSFPFSPCLHKTTASFLGKPCPSPGFAGRTQDQTGLSGWRHSGSPRLRQSGNFSSGTTSEFASLTPDPRETTREARRAAAAAARGQPGSSPSLRPSPSTQRDAASCSCGDSGNFGHRPVPLRQSRSAVPPHASAPLTR